MPSLASHEVVEIALAHCRGDCMVLLAEESDAHLRWAGNALTTNGLTNARTLTVMAVSRRADGMAAGVMTGPAYTVDEIRGLVETAQAKARAATTSADGREFVAAGVDDDFAAPAPETAAAVFRPIVGPLASAFRRAAVEGREWYGFAQHELTTFYLGTSTGTRLRHEQPNGSLEVTVRTDGRSVWSGQSSPDFHDIDVHSIDDRLVQRLGWGSRSVQLPAGRYEAVLPPAAVADLLAHLSLAFSGRDAVEGRSVLSGPDGKTRLGERLTTLPLTLHGNPAQPGLQSVPFLMTRRPDADRSLFDNGHPVAATDWIRDGGLRNLLTSRHTAELTGLPFVPHVDNLILSGGADATGTAEDLLTGVSRGLLLTSVWYVRMVDQARLLVTGLSRDGVFLIEDGEVVGAVNNFRFNESPLDLLSRATQAGASERTFARDSSFWFPRVMAPALRVPDFNATAPSPGT